MNQQQHIRVVIADDQELVRAGFAMVIGSQADMEVVGQAGDGKGNLHTSGKYIIPPTNLLEERIINQPPGETFHVITAGWGVMGAHASLIRAEDRWKITAFVEKVLQQK